MGRFLRRTFVVILVVLAVAFAAAFAVKGRGLSARRDASALEDRVARAAWRWLVPAGERDRANPLAGDRDARRRGLEHWADHCAICHDNDGSGRTEIGRNLFPPAPDMRQARTQELTDGELFYAIEHGIPWTGMPAWSTGTEAGEHSSWELVLFIRTLHELTPDELEEMEKLNPKSQADHERERAIDDFLSGSGGSK